MTTREQRVVNAFMNSVRSGVFTPDYAIILIEDNQKYGYLTEETKEQFYVFLDEYESEVAAKNDTVDLLGVSGETATTGGNGSDFAEDGEENEAEDAPTMEDKEEVTGEETAPEGEDIPENDEVEAEPAEE